MQILNHKIDSLESSLKNDQSNQIRYLRIKINLTIFISTVFKMGLKRTPKMGLKTKGIKLGYYSRNTFSMVVEIYSRKSKQK